MSRLFGKARKAPPVMEVLADLSSNCEELMKREDHYKHKILEEKRVILANGKKNLSGACVRTTTTSIPAIILTRTLSLLRGIVIDQPDSI
jgi:hypothetical protein